MSRRHPRSALARASRSLRAPFRGASGPPNPLLLLVLVLAWWLPGVSRAQQPAQGTFLIANGSPDAPTQRFAKLLAVEVSRRASLVSETGAAALLSRPLAAAVSDCSGDDLCYVALGQVVGAATVVVAYVKETEPGKYDCTWRVIDVKTGKTVTPGGLRTPNSDPGLAGAALQAAEKIVVRPRAVAVVTPPPLVTAPTPVPLAPTPTPLAAAIGTPEPEATPGTPGLDAVPEPVRPRKPRPPLTKDPAFWGIAGAGVLVLGLGAFLGSSTLTPDEEKDEGTSTVEVRF